MAAEAKTEKSPQSLFERLSPVLVILSIGLAFFVGMLWQRVQYLEKGGVKVSGETQGTANTTPAANPQQQKLSDLVAVAGDVGVNENEFKSCLDGKEHAQKVETQYQGGIAAGVTGTPANFVVNDKGEVWFVPGAFPYDQIKPVLDVALGNGGEVPAGSITKLAADRVAKLPKVSGDDHRRGPENAKVYLIEYSDFECPYCSRFHPTTQQILDEYDDVAIIYRHFPLDSIHPKARSAALASECVFEQGGDEAFWKFADEIFGS